MTGTASNQRRRPNDAAIDTTETGGGSLTELAADGVSAKTSVLYVRVSTKDQAERDGEADGYSIPAQIEACQRKAQSLGAIVVEAFVDRGESARSADRPELQRMLRSLKKSDIDFVIVHKIDRLARNRQDDIAITTAIAASGAKLVSVTENIDETPSGFLMHGIMSSIAEFYSRNLALEVEKGIQQKFQAGGTVSLAPIGYINARKVVGGIEVRTVELDPERAHHIRWAFDAYATGDWTLSQLAEELETRGLTQRPTRKRVSRPLPPNKLHELLRNRYYLGFVRYRGLENEGKHSALIDSVTFERVQRVLAQHRVSGERSYRHKHYLAGSLTCGRCKSRMAYGVSRGKNGETYGYFFCLGRHSKRTHCELRYLPAAAVEEAVEEQWLLERPPTDLVELQRNLLMDFDSLADRSRAESEAIKQRIHRVRRERVKWAEKAMEGVVPDDVARDKQAQLAQTLLRLESDVSRLDRLGDLQRDALEAALRLVADCGTAYAEGDNDLRRAYNQAWFRTLEIDEDESGRSEITEVERCDEIQAIRTAKIRKLDTVPDGGRTERSLWSPSGFRAISQVGSSNVPTLVGMTGFEPATPSSRTRCATKLRYIPKALGPEGPEASSSVCEIDCLVRSSNGRL